MSECLVYDEVLEAYQTSLVTVLRGFSSGAPFLATWVPEEDHAYSILGIFEAAADFGLPGLELSVSEERLQSMGERRLIELLQPLGEVSWREGHVFVQFSARPDMSQRRQRSGCAPPLATRVEEIGQPGVHQLAKSWDLPDRYHEALARLASSFSHRVEQCADQSGLTCRRLGACLRVELGEEHRIVNRATFCGDLQATTAQLLEFCCLSIEGRPLYEAADHGVIAMEAALRAEGPRPAQGIMLAEWSVPAFALLNEMLRELNQQAGERVLNFFDGPVSAKWKKLSDPGRIEMLEEALGGHALAGKVEVVRVEGQRRVVVAFADDSLSNAQRQQALLNLERHFKARVEPALHLYLEPKPDKNKLRQQKGIRL
ncbi:MAG: hypothetical protein U0931_07465 [Vulcanimicrobiota bacterium]